MKKGYGRFVVAAAVALLAAVYPAPGFSQMRDMPMAGSGEGCGKRMEMPMPGHGAGHGQMMGMPMAGHGGGHGQPMPGQGPGPGQGMMDRMERTGDMIAMCLHHAEAIGLTDEQIAKLKRVHREVQKKEARFRADLTIARIDRMEIMDVKDFDLEKASSVVKKVQEIRTAHQLEMLKAMKEIRTLLTDEQFKKMTAMMMPMRMQGRDR